MTRIGYPTEDFPNPAPFFLDIPDDWNGVHVPQALLAARGPEPVDGYRSNVVVTWQRVAIDGDVEELATALVEDMAAAEPGFEVTSSRTGEAAGLPVIGLEASITGRDGQRLGQRHFVVAGVATSRRTRDLFHVVGTYDADDAIGGRAIGDILQSFVVVDPGAINVASAA